MEEKGIVWLDKIVVEIIMLENKLRNNDYKFLYIYNYIINNILI